MAILDIVDMYLKSLNSYKKLKRNGLSNLLHRYI